MLTTLLVGLVSAQAAPFSIAIPPLNAVNLAPGEGALHASTLETKLIARGAKVVSQRDITAVLGMERQQQLMGNSCSDSCMAELAAAMGTEALVMGDIGKLGSTYSVSLKLISAKNGQTLGVHTASPPNADAMAFELDRAAWSLLSQAAIKYPERIQAGVEPVQQPKGFRRNWAAVPAIITLVGAVTGTLGLVQSGARYDGIKTAPNEGAAARFRDDGKAWQTVAWVSFAVAGAAAVATAVTFFLGEPAPATPTTWFGADGSGGIAVGGRF